LLIGKNSLSGLNQTYIRKAGENKTILVNANLVIAINQSDWKQPAPVATPTPEPTE
jgi:hypothetical protein